MVEAPKDYEQDEIITVKLSRKEFDIVRKIIAREQAAGWFDGWIKNHWVWIVGGGILTFLYIGDQIKSLFNGTH